VLFLVLSNRPNRENEYDYDYENERVAP